MGNKQTKFVSVFKKFYYAIFLVFAYFIIYLLYPKQGVFKYEFQKGKPWAHETLIAPFDFPILKDKAVFETEKDSLSKQYVPYFKVDEDVKVVQLEELNRAIENAFLEYDYSVTPEKSQEFTAFFSNLIGGIYNRGIIKNPLDSYGELNEEHLINKVQNNVATIVHDSTLITLQEAYVYASVRLRDYIQTDTVLLGVEKYIDLSQYLVDNVDYDKDFNDAQIDELLNTVSRTRGVVQSGMRIISKGDLVTGENYMILESLKQAYQHNRAYTGWISWIIAGQMLLIAIILASLVLYLHNFNGKIFRKKRNFSFIITTVLAVFVLTRSIYDSDFLSIYIIPFCILPMIIRTFLGARMAIFTHLMAMFLVAFMAPNSFEFVFIQTIAGIVAVISLSKLHRRGHLVVAALVVTLVYIVAYLGFGLVKEGNFENLPWGDLKWFVINGVLLLTAYPLIWVFERVFGFTSDVTLMELSDTNHPLLREMAEIAPGTFQHSMQVANLAEDVILKIGGNPMLVRTGALYHDVGKIKSAHYFIENQLGGKNPHDALSYKDSAAKIISHVADGVTLAHKHKIPEKIVDFIRTHHGTSMAKYFYLKYKEEHPDEDIRENDFEYPGPNPTSRETAVVMLADGVEAATRSLPDKNEESLKRIINQIVDAKVNNHELDDAPITFKDIKNIKEILLEKLKNIYHLRIQYPTEKKEEAK